MSYAALMVHFDDTPAAHARTRLAVDLAARFGAALIGITGYSYVPSFLAGGSAAKAAQPDSDYQEMLGALTDFGAKFRDLAKHARKVEWRGKLESADDLVPREARAADLIILGGAQDPADLFYSLHPDVVILRAGRPVLLVPAEISGLEARRVVVAWKDSRESRRAVRDALPFLTQAHDVVIVTICEHGNEAEARKSIDDLAVYLQRHKVNVAAKACLHTTQPVAGELVRFAKNENSDLIVTGAYGRSRLGEWALGGVTHDLLWDSPLCCLLSH